MFVIIGIDVSLLVLAVWFGIYKKRVYAAMMIFIAAVIVTVIYSYIVTKMPSVKMPSFRLPSGSSPTNMFDPTRYVEQTKYVAFWASMFSTILSGFWARLIAVSSLIGAFWFGVYRRRPGLGVFLFLMSIAATYLFGILKILWR